MVHINKALPRGFMIRLKRIYAAPAALDGYRILVDRLWPRGLNRGAAAIDEWVKSLAPSPQLRIWFAHRADHWLEFQLLYRLELSAPEVKPELVRLRQLAETGPLTLLYAARNETENHARVLCDFLNENG
jgi:ribokinase